LGDPRGYGRTAHPEAAARRLLRGLEPRRPAEKALTAVVQEAYVQGSSVDDLVRAMGMEGISKSQVSRLCGEIDDRVRPFLSRPIEGEWPYVWFLVGCNLRQSTARPSHCLGRSHRCCWCQH